MSRQIVRKSDIGAPPARMSAGAPPILPVRRGAFRNIRASSTPGRKRRAEDNLDVEESDSEQTSTAEDQEENDSVEEGKKEDEPGEKVKKTSRKKRRFRLTDSVAKSKKKAERRAQLAAERKEREEQKQEEETSKSKEQSPSPPPLPKEPSIRTYSSMQLFCDHIVRKLQNKDPDEYFAYPVTASMAPDYHEMIKEPMDFSTMRQKIENDDYGDIHALKKDADLIVTNALTYNQPGTVYHIAAQRLNQIVQFYFSEQYMRYLYHTLPFTKDIPLEKLGLTLKVRPRPVPKVTLKTAIVDNVTPSVILESVDQSLKQKLSKRVPDLSKILPDTTNGKEPKCHLAFLDNKDGAVCLNVINPASDETQLTVGNLIGKLQEGTPGLCAPQEHKSNIQVPITYLSYGPFSSFAPQFDSTWATLCERDSKLLLSAYGDKESATNALSLRKMVENSGEHMIKVVDDLLDTLTDGEHRRTIAALENGNKEEAPMPLEDKNIKKTLSDIETLENIGIDVSFVSDIRKLLDVKNSPPRTPQEHLNKTATMISDLSMLEKNRLSSTPPTTLIDQPPPGSLELNLSQRVKGELQTQIAQFAKPGDIISPPVIHNAVGLNEEDLDLLNEFFTAPTGTV